MSRARSVVVAAAGLAGCLSVQGQSIGKDTTIEVTVPAIVADRAVSRMNGDTSAPAPVLILEGVEAVGERLRIRVYGPPPTSPPGAAGRYLGSTSLVGSNEPQPRAPSQTIDLVVPLNDDASLLLASRPASLKLRFELTAGSSLETVRYKRVYFSSSNR